MMYVNLNKAVNLYIYCSNNEVEVNKMHHVYKQLDEPLLTYRQLAESHLACLSACWLQVGSGT